MKKRCAYEVIAAAQLVAKNAVAMPHMRELCYDMPVCALPLRCFYATQHGSVAIVESAYERKRCRRA